MSISPIIVERGRKTLRETTGPDTYNIGIDAVSVTIAGNMKSGDVINIEGLASEYRVSASGRTFTLRSDTQVIKFQLAATNGSASVRFADGDLTASFSNKLAKLGEQKLGSKQAPVNDANLGLLDSSEAAFSVAAGSNIAAATYAITHPASMVEGDTATFTIKTTGVTAGTLLSYTLTGTGNAAANTASGVATVDSDGFAVVSSKVAANTVFGDAGTLKLDLVNGKASSTVITVADKSTDPASLAQTFALTTGTDNWTGAGANDTVTGTETTFTGLDTIDGAGGNDTLTLSDVAGDKLDLSIATIKNIETINLSSSKGLGGASTNLSTLAGLTAVNIALGDISAADQSITVAGATALTLNAKGAIATTALTTTGGSTATIILANGNADNSGESIKVNGADGKTTSVSVVQTVGASGKSAAVAVADPNQGSATKSSTIATVTLDGLADANATIASDALATLNVASSKKDVTVTNATATTLGLTLNNNSAGTINVGSTYTSLNVTTTGKDATNDLTAGGATTISFAGDAALTVGTMTAAKLATATIAGSAGLTANLSSISTLTSIVATSSSGANSLTIDGTKTTYAGGSGVDTITVTAAPTKSLNGGTGTADVFVWDKNGNYATNTKVTGFEILGAGASVSGNTLDVTGFTGMSVAAGLAGTVEFTNVAANSTLTIAADPTKDMTVTLKDASGTVDTLSVTLGTSKTTGLDISGKNLTLTGYETLKLNSIGDGKDTGVNKLTVVDDDLKTITITGDNDLAITHTKGSVTSINGAAVSNTKADLDLSGVTVATAGATITGGSGSDKLNGNAGADSITGGAGQDTITSGTGLDTLAGGAGQDVFVLSANANGNTYATITDATLGTNSTGDQLNMSGLMQQSVAADTTLGAKVALADTATFADYLAAAVTGHSTAATNAVLTWFTFGSSTYIVVDNTNADTFTAGATGDQVVRVSGLLDLTNTTVTQATSVVTLVA